jgi:hypothetical protein
VNRSASAKEAEAVIERSAAVRRKVFFMVEILIDYNNYNYYSTRHATADGGKQERLQPEEPTVREMP